MNEIEMRTTEIESVSKPLDLVVILGPTASGKTKLAVALANAIGGEIISADSRQVYRGMDIGTGKDLQEYTINGKSIPYHLINMYNPGEKYHVFQFQQDFQNAFEAIRSRGNLPILCGGTGLYIESVLLDRSMAAVPVDLELRGVLEQQSNEELQAIFSMYPSDYDSLADTSTRKRLIRAIEIKQWLRSNSQESLSILNEKKINYQVFGIDLPVELRRERITKRLSERVGMGMIEEVEKLLATGVTAEELIYYGLEYKYVTLYLTGALSKDAMLAKLETEIHRYAKRQMTYFRHMEKKGIPIQWLDGTLGTSEISQKIIQSISLEKF